MSSKLIGTWKLTEFIGKNSDGEISNPFGENPVGFITFTEDGHMFTTITFSDRPLFSSKDRLSATEKEKVLAYDTHISYCSEYRIEENKILLDVLASSVESWVGGTEERYFSFENEKLILKTAPREIGGKKLTMKVSWERAI